MSYKNSKGKSRQLIGPGISVTEATLGYGTNTLFNKLSIALPGGKITCLLGPSGIGKSSLLKLIAGIGPRPLHGLVSASDGLEISDRVTYMDQRDLLLPWLNVIDNVTLGSRLRGEQKLLDGAINLLKDVGLTGFEYHLPKVLSGGMRQRAALARTLMEDKPIVLMDEPFSSLDSLTRRRLQDLAGRLLVNRTVLLVTHDPAEAVRLAHRIHVMNGVPPKIGHAIMVPGEPTRDESSAHNALIYRELLRNLHSAERNNS